MDFNIKDWVKKLKRVKGMEYFVFIMVIAVVLSLFTNMGREQKDDQPDLPETAQFSDNVSNSLSDQVLSPDNQEERLRNVLSSIDGAGIVDVMISYKSGREIVPAVSTVHSDTETQEQDSGGGVRSVTQTETNTQPVDIQTSEGTQALILKEIEPEIQGVIVIAQGADDIMVRMELQRAVQTVLGINANQVEVFVMDKEIIKE